MDNSISGWLVWFTGPENKDLHGDYFTERTDFDLETRSQISVFFDHGQDEDIRRLRIATGKIRKVERAGIWITATPVKGLPVKFWKSLMDMARDGDLAWSSGALGHMVEREADGWLSSWFLSEASLTNEPAEPNARAMLSDSAALALAAPKMATRATSLFQQRQQLKAAHVEILKRQCEYRIWREREWLNREKN